MSRRNNTGYLTTWWKESSFLQESYGTHLKILKDYLSWIAAERYKFLFLNRTVSQHSNCLPPKTKNKDDIETTDWLDKLDQQSVVNESFGSLAAIEENEFLEIAWGLKNSERPFLWVVRLGSVQGTKWLESFPCGFLENISHSGKIVKWVNQLEVLAHPTIGTFWTHCGGNSTLESICEAVPMICTPCFTDQHVNSRYIVDVWRVGTVLERSKIERKEIEKVLRNTVMEKRDCVRDRC